MSILVWIIPSLILPFLMAEFATHKFAGLSDWGFFLSLGAAVVAALVGLGVAGSAILAIIVYVLSSSKIRRRKRVRNGRN